MSEGNPLTGEDLKQRIKRCLMLDYYYIKRIDKLNELLAAIDQLKHIEKRNKKK